MGRGRTGEKEMNRAFFASHHRPVVLASFCRVFERRTDSDDGAGRQTAAQWQGSGTGGAGNSSPPPIVTPSSASRWCIFPAGTFIMGSQRGLEDEKPEHEVRIDSFL